MTRNLSLLALAAGLIIGINLFFACTKVETDDAPPGIKILMPLNNDTLFIYTDTDTILPIFSASLSDNEGLSSYKFRIRHLRDSIKGAPGDTTAYFYKNYQRASIFGMKDTIIKHSFEIDTIISVTDSNSNTRRLPIWQGVYQLDASVVDMHGNITIVDSINVVIVKTKYIKKK
ncbi:uncharacterized protein DUF4625 [Dysgonomonas alginatilytica]|uniref:Uncharacterized protein DUF4625 n=1 Tax=Dysgonomonas alginatilytica TaxID=1605892 RepID=A0A2V3PR65_9BACT|nr:DUF4625 domain-containing protein [Dysgonomonas alginatilytica]PXV64464.1 uncharacterized protein DUF4625 [Dysgonomonas alginatilytica]